MSQQEILHLIAVYGYWVIAVGATVDSFGVPVPGEVMLLSAGMYAGATHRILLPLAIIAAAAGAICGDNLSYALGRFGGTRFLHRYGHVLHFGRRRQRIARYLFRRFGGGVVLGGRFIPVIHIGTAFLAGTEEMGWLQFALLNGLACLVWSTLLGSAGYLLGAAVLRVGDVIAAASIPLALVILVAAGSGLHFAEKRLQREADRAEAKDRAA